MSKDSAAHRYRAMNELTNWTGTSCHDLPVVARHAYKGVQPGTWALLTALPTKEGNGKLLHIAWRNMDHDQLSDVMTLEEAMELFEAMPA